MTTRDEAVGAFAGLFADAIGDMADLYAQGGAEAVADAAYVTGGPSREELARRYEALVSEARQGQRKNAPEAA